MSQNLRPARATSPGRIMERELEARGWTQKDLAEIMGRPPQAINEIIRGGKQITPDTALELAEAFSTSAELWLNLEANYRLHIAREGSNNGQISRKSRLYSLAPINELLKRKWIDTPESVDDLESSVCRFLEITSPAETPQLWAGFRHAEQHGPKMSAEIAWLKRVEHLARAQQVANFSISNLEQSIPDLLKCAEKPEYVSGVPQMLLNLGVHFVVVPPLPKTSLDGAAFYVDRLQQPVVALTLRHDRIDAFWCSLAHELAHIVLGHKGLHLDTIYPQDEHYSEGETEGQAGAISAQEESQVNNRALEWLLDADAFHAFIRSKNATFSQQDIESFAGESRRRQGVVPAQLQHGKHLGYNNYRSLLGKVKPHLAEWIDTPYPGAKQGAATALAAVI